MLFKTGLIILAFFSVTSLALGQNVGINTADPEYNMDIRGTNDQYDGGDLQLATPSLTNFLRFFGGRTDDANPFMAFHDLDTFHIVTTLPDFSTYTRRMTMYPDGKLGLGTDEPGAELDVRTSAIDDGAEFRLSNSDDSYFLRLFSGKPSNPRPAVYWNYGSKLDFARFDGNLDYKPFLSLDGKTIEVLNNNGSVFIGENTGSNNNSFNNTAVGSFSLRNNITGANNTVLGYQAGGSSGAVASFANNVLLGYQAGYNINQSNRLYIENSSSASPLIYGEFDTNLIRINGRQEITGNLNLNQGIASDVALRINGQEAIWSNGSYFSYGFGTNYNYFARPIRVGPIEGTTSPFADLHLVDNAGITNLSIESQNHDAVLQLAGDTDDPFIHWTMRRRNSDGDLEWKHNNLSFMKLTTDAKLGLGVSNPTKTLDVAGDSRIYKSLNSNATPALFVATIENTSNTNTFYNNGLKIIAGNDNFIGGPFPEQSLFIGFSRPDGTVLGGIHQQSANGVIYYQLSDRRRKKDIKPTITGIQTLMQIKVRDYMWKEGGDNQLPTTGFIAQEMSEVYPSAAKRGGTDPKLNPWQIAPTQLIPLMVKSTQDQQKEIESLRSENQDLRDRLDRIEKLLAEQKQ